MKIVVVGAGNAGCFAALHYGEFTKYKWPWLTESVEVELIHNPDILPEKVGQATFQEAPNFLYRSIGFDWYNNKSHSTPKTGILYEGWGKANEKWFHSFPAGEVAMHFCPSEMQKNILNSGVFKVTEGDIHPQDVDADYVFDCRGKPTDFTDYDKLENPINAVILGKPNWDISALWTRCIATPDGWTFVIPTHRDSPSFQGSVGYLYNQDITSKEDAEKNFLDMFDVDISGHFSFNNYIAKNPIIDDRIFLNGNRLFFLEPLEATALQSYMKVNRYIFDFIFHKNITSELLKSKIHLLIEQIQNFVLWHYHFGSQYDTPFWEYAKKLTFNDYQFRLNLNQVKEQIQKEGDMWGQLEVDLTKTVYGQWSLRSIKNWYIGMGEK